MKRTIVVIIIMVILFGISTVFADDAINQTTITSENPIDLNQAVKKTIDVPGNTVVTVKTIKVIIAGKTHVGDLIDLKVSQDVIVNSQIIIKKDSLAVGQISAVEKRGTGGKPASVSLKVINITTVDNQIITVLGSFTQDGQDKTKSSTGLSLVTMGWGSFLPGGEAVIVENTEIKTIIPSNITVSIE